MQKPDDNSARPAVVPTVASEGTWGPHAALFFSHAVRCASSTRGWKYYCPDHTTLHKDQITEQNSLPMFAMSASLLQVAGGTPGSAGPGTEAPQQPSTSGKRKNSPVSTQHWAGRGNIYWNFGANDQGALVLGGRDTREFKTSLMFTEPSNAHSIINQGRECLLRC